MHPTTAAPELRARSILSSPPQHAHVSYMMTLKTMLYNMFVFTDMQRILASDFGTAEGCAEGMAELATLLKRTKSAADALDAVNATIAELSLQSDVDDVVPGLMCKEFASALVELGGAQLAAGHRSWSTICQAVSAAARGLSLSVSHAWTLAQRNGCCCLIDRLEAQMLMVCRPSRAAAGLMRSPAAALAQAPVPIPRSDPGVAVTAAPAQNTGPDHSAPGPHPLFTWHQHARPSAPVANLPHYAAYVWHPCMHLTTPTPTSTPSPAPLILASIQPSIQPRTPPRRPPQHCW